MNIMIECDNIRKKNQPKILPIARDPDPCFTGYPLIFLITLLVVPWIWCLPK